MLKIISFICVTLFCLYAHAQSAYDRTYNFRHDDGTFNRTIIYAKNNDVLLYEMSSDMGINTSSALIRTDADGNIKWYKNYTAFAEPIQLQRAVETNDGDIVLLFTRYTSVERLIVRLDSAGNFKWSKTLPRYLGDMLKWNNIAAFGAHETILCGEYSHVGFFTIIDSAGDVTMKAGLTLPDSFDPTPNNRHPIFVSGSKKAYWSIILDDGLPGTTCLLSIDSAGNKNFSKMLRSLNSPHTSDYFIENFVVTPDEKIVMSLNDLQNEQHYIVQMNKQGVMEWGYRYTYANKKISYFSLSIDGDDIYLWALYEDPRNNYYALVGKLDDYGNISSVFGALGSGYAQANNYGLASVKNGHISFAYRTFPMYRTNENTVAGWTDFTHIVSAPFSDISCCMTPFTGPVIKHAIPKVQQLYDSSGVWFYPNLSNTLVDSSIHITSFKNFESYKLCPSRKFEQKTIANNVYVAYNQMCNADTGNILIIGTTGNSSQDSASQKILLAKKTTLGETIWTKTLGTGTNFGHGTAIKKTTNNTYIIAGTLQDGANGLQGYIACIDSNATIIWQQTVGGAVDEYFLDVGINSQGQILATGFVTTGGINKKGLAVMLDLAGNVLWQKEYVQSNREVINKAIPWGNNWLLPGTSNTHAYMVLIDANGNVIWSKKINTTWQEDEIVDALVDGNNVWVLGGLSVIDTQLWIYSNPKLFVALVDSQGNISYEKKITYGHHYPRAIEKLSTGYIVVTGEVREVAYPNSYYVSKGFALLQDDTFTLVTRRHYNLPPSDTWVNDVVETADNSVMMCGNSYRSFLNSANYEVLLDSISKGYLIKTDFDLNSGCTAGFEEFGWWQDYIWVPFSTNFQNVTTSALPNTGQSTPTLSAAGITMPTEYVCANFICADFDYEVNCGTVSFTIPAHVTANAVSVNWLVNNIQVPDSTAFIWHFNATGIYTVRLTVTDALGNSYLSSKQVEVTSVSSTVLPTVSITADTILCIGNLIPNYQLPYGTITAQYINAGLQPGFSWYYNNVLHSQNTPVFMLPDTLKNGDIIYVVIERDSLCGTYAKDTSNILRFQARNQVPGTVTITPAPEVKVCPGEQVTFSATYTGAGTNPTFQWLIGTFTSSESDTNTFVTAPITQADGISCRYNSYNQCAYPNTIFSSATTINLFTDFEPVVYFENDSIKTNDIAGVTYSWVVNADTLNVNQPSIPVTANGVYETIINWGNCLSTASFNYLQSAVNGPASIPFSISPNPSNGVYHILGSISSVLVYNLVGNLVYINNSGKTVIDLSNQPAGVYNCSAITPSGNYFFKLIKL